MLAKNESGTMTYMHPDHIGSSNLITNSGGSEVETVEYYPFGSQISASEEERGYEGKELDSTGLNYFGARYYDSELRMFTQPDPVIANLYNPQNLNRYSFELNNPYKYTDPDGRTPWDVTLDPMLFAAAVNDYNNDPSIMNSIDVAASGIGLLPVVPSLGILTRGGKLGWKYGGDALSSMGSMFKNKKGMVAIGKRTVKNAQIDDHLYKRHVRRGLSENKLKSSTKHSQSLFSNKINPETVVGEGFEKGINIRDGYQVYDTGKTIGYSRGKATQYIGVRYNDLGEKIGYHGYPITKSEFNKALKTQE